MKGLSIYHWREIVERRRKNVVLVSAVVLALVLVALVTTKTRTETIAQGPRTLKAWYTTDDGRTWFGDVADKVVPFDHAGKPAYRCYVWTCDGGQTKFVSHLERLSASARQRFTGTAKMELLAMLPGSREVKSPLTGDTGWIAAEAPQATQIQIPVCQGGKPGLPRPVEPD